MVDKNLRVKERNEERFRITSPGDRAAGGGAEMHLRWAFGLGGSHLPSLALVEQHIYVKLSLGSLSSTLRWFIQHGWSSPTHTLSLLTIRVSQTRWSSLLGREGAGKENEERNQSNNVGFHWDEIIKEFFQPMGIDLNRFIFQFSIIIVIIFFGNGRSWGWMPSQALKQHSLATTVTNSSRTSMHS